MAWALEHPWMTFILAIVALSVVDSMVGNLVEIFRKKP